jgi:hypothetical protein
LQDVAIGFGPQILALDEAAFFYNHGHRRGREQLSKEQARRALFQHDSHPCQPRVPALGA